MPKSDCLHESFNFRRWMLGKEPLNVQYMSRGQRGWSSTCCWITIKANFCPQFDWCCTGQGFPPIRERNVKGAVLQLLCFHGNLPDSEVLCKEQLQNQALCTHALVVILKEIEWDQQNGTSAQRKIQRLPSAPCSCSCSELWCAVTFIGWFHQLIYLINLDLTLYKGYVIKWCNSFLSHRTSQDLF